MSATDSLCISLASIVAWTPCPIAVVCERNGVNAYLVLLMTFGAYVLILTLAVALASQVKG